MISYKELVGWIVFLKQEKADVEAAISRLEKLLAIRSNDDLALVHKLASKRRGRPPNSEKELRLQKAWDNRPKRRGRKKMSSKERKEVSARMTKYWAGRRQNDKPLSPEEIRLRTGDIDPVKVN